MPKSSRILEFSHDPGEWERGSFPETPVGAELVPGGIETLQVAGRIGRGPALYQVGRRRLFASAKVVEQVLNHAAVVEDTEHVL